jgi:molybdate transport system ATP-binding protein
MAAAPEDRVMLTLRDVRWHSERFSLEIDASFGPRVTGVFGVSGSGKSTLIELVAGLRRPDGGVIALGDEVLVDVARGVWLPPERRRLGYVPQDAALFPHLSVGQNLRYGERRAAAVAGSVPFGRDHVCELLGISDLLTQSAARLSGGERQRVALARALVSAPRLLLLDEPLAALDAARKDAILPYLRRVRDEFRLPMLFVSHLPREILALCDEMLVLHDGRVAQAGAVDEVFRRPATPDVARSVGVETIVPGRIVAGADDLVTVAVGGATLTSLAVGLPPEGRDVLVNIRAEDVILVPDDGAARTSARNQLAATVLAVVSEGATVRIELDAGFPLVALLTRQASAELSLTAGRRVRALVKAPHVHLIPR